MFDAPTTTTSADIAGFFFVFVDNNLINGLLLVGDGVFCTPQQELDKGCDVRLVQARAVECRPLGGLRCDNAHGVVVGLQLQRHAPGELALRRSRGKTQRRRAEKKKKNKG